MNACIQLNPSNAKAYTFIGHLYCCEMQSKCESVELAQEAVQCYRAALNASPMDREAKIALSQLFFDLNDVQSVCVNCGMKSNVAVVLCIECILYKECICLLMEAMRLLWKCCNKPQN